jgi:hypothetical protein
MNNLHLFVALLLIGACSAGRVYPWGEPFITYPNKGLVSQIDVYFSLDTPLPAGNVIRIAFPFSTQITVASAVIF